MRRRMIAEPEAALSSMVHPKLRATLGCLDTKLDDELVRYRRAQKLAQLQQQGSVDASLAAASMQPPRLKLEKSQATLQLPTMPVAQGAIAPPPIAVQGYGPQAESATQRSRGLALDEDDPSDYLESTEQLLRSLDDEPSSPRREQAGVMSTVFTPLGLGSMLLLLLSSITFGYLLMNPANFRQLTTGRSPETAAPTDAVPPAPTRSLQGRSRPSGVEGPDLSAQEFRQVDLGSLSTLEQGDRPRQSEFADLEAPAEVEVEGSAAADDASQTRSRIGTEAELSTVQQLASERSGARSASSTAPEAAASPAPQPSSPPVEIPRPREAQVESQPAPSPAVVAPTAPAPQAALPVPSSIPSVAPAPSSTAAASSYIYVVADYVGDRSLNTAREVVPDAYVRNLSSGAVVQFGAFSSAASAESLVRELQQQGISARTYRGN
ncbi:MAG: SPOR domain-containing protein [Kaiparowitsia implicata GSE-PSE-MK54-09C]|nr:SPOR domain-containing protein [Kaiparowitsia implicata GSE-PSE-MK54-09C]